MKDSNEIRIHVFNPEHDIALAANQKRFTAPHAGRQMRADLGFIPALWANDSDFVIVDDVEAALEAVRHIRKNAHKVEFITLSDLKKLELSDNVHVQIMPWGWDCTIKEQLLRADSRLEAFMPDDASIDIMRQLSNRRFASEHLLPILHDTNCKVVATVPTFVRVRRTRRLVSLRRLSRWFRSTLTLRTCRKKHRTGSTSFTTYLLSRIS